MGGKKNTKGGKGHKKGKRQTDTKRELEFRDEGQDYAQVTKMLGDGRVQAECFDGTQRICHIRGKFRKRVWIAMGDIVLLGLRDFQDGKADIIIKYTPDEAKTLKAYGEIPESVVIGGTENADTAEHDDLAFDAESDEDEKQKENNSGGSEEEEKGEIRENEGEKEENWAVQLQEL